MIEAQDVLLRPRMIGAAFDIDGTLLRSDHTLSPLVIEACRLMSARGVWFTLVSARPPLSILSIAGALKSVGPWGALNGALVFSDERKMLYRCPLPRDATQRIVGQYINHRNVSVNLYSKFDWWVNRLDERVLEEARIVGFSPSTMLGSDTFPEIDKILLIVDPSMEAEIRQELSEFSQILVTLSKGGYIEITHRDVSKGRALEAAAASVGVPMEKMLAAGDGENDISMLAACGLPLAMSHSPASVKRVAKVVLGTNDDDSLVEYISRIFDLRAVGSHDSD